MRRPTTPPSVVESYRERLGTELVYRRLETNTGGSGGFSEGMRVAYELGSTWMWLMDDDVEVIPDGLARMGAWAPRFKSIQGRRYDYDGSEFYWQYRVAEPARHPDPLRSRRLRLVGLQADELRMLRGHVHPSRHRGSRSAFPTRGSSSTGTTQVYGWLASRKTTSVIVDEFVLRRTREIKQWDMGIRHMNASSDAYRYYIMRNRAHMKQYYRSLGVYRPVLFAARNCALTFAQGAHPADLRRAQGARHEQPLPRASATAARSRRMPRGSRCRRSEPGSADG